MRNTGSSLLLKILRLSADVVMVAGALSLLGPPAMAHGQRGGFSGHGGGHFGGHGGGHFGGRGGWRGAWIGGFGLGLGVPYFYDSWPYYDFAYAPPVIYANPQPPTVMQTTPPVSSTWYYCDNPAGYYPYVRFCGGPWRAVPAMPTPSP